MTNFVVSNQAQFNKALSQANGGDSISISKSFQGVNIYISGFNKPGGLTITSENGEMASAAMIKIANSSGIRVQNFDVLQAANKSLTVSVKASANIEFSGLHIHGDTDLTKAGVGMEVRTSKSVVVQNSNFDHLSGGIYFSNSSEVTFQGNRFSEIVNDGIQGTSTSNLVIKDNYFTNWQHFGQVHPDCIQLYTRAGDAIAHDITISGNVYNRGTGTATQGIWVKNDGGTAPFENVNITGNSIIGGMYNGIGVTAVGTAVVSGNLVQSYADQPSRIIVYDTRGSVAVQNNAATWFSNTDSKTSFSGNSVTSYLPSANVQAITDAVAALANAGLTGASSAIQDYLASISASMAAVDVAASGSNSSLPVIGSVAEIFAHPDLVRTTGAQISGDNSVTISQFNALSAISKLSLAPGATLVVHGTAAELLSFNGRAAHSPLTTAVAISGDNVLNAVQAANIAAFDHVSLDPGASIVVRDWAVNVSKVMDTLETAASHGLIGSITLFDKAPAFTLTDTQYLNDADVLGIITNPTRQIVTVAADHSVTARDGSAQLDGSAGNAILTASDSGNTLIGGAGDTLIGGLGKDTFVFHGHFGQDVVNDFDTSDVLQFDRAMVADLRHLAPKLHQVGSDVVIDLGGGDAVTLVGIDLASLHASNFRFF